MRQTYFCWGMCFLFNLWVFNGYYRKANAQIIPDGTLGNEGSLVTRKVNLNGVEVDRIDSGAIRGNNLFHSFQEFNVNQGQRVYFANPVGISNILSRVTGNKASQIRGTLGIDGQANLFFINPNGIIFGQNARLDINGSFLASTANSVVFDNGFAFSATNPQVPPLLTISVPSGLQYGATTSDIEVQDANLNVDPGKTLALVGGNITLVGSILEVEGGQIELGGLVGAGLIGLDVNGQNLSLSFPNGIPRADITFNQSAEANVQAGGGGDIRINAHNLELLEGSKVMAGIVANAGSPNSVAGNVEINTTGAANFDGEDVNSTFYSDSTFSGVYNRLEDNAQGQGGNIIINTNSLSVTNGAVITASTDGLGNGGDVIIKADEQVTFAQWGRFSGRSSGAFSSVKSDGIGNAGVISIQAKSLVVKDTAILNTNIFGQGNAGNININVSDTVAFIGTGSNDFPSGAYSSLEPGQQGNPGSIKITARSLLVADGAVITTSTDGLGDGGKIIIDADMVSVEGQASNNFRSGLYSAVSSKAVGNGGAIKITANSLSLTKGAQITASTFGEGKAGDIQINASSATLDGVGINGVSSGIFSTTEKQAGGRGGEITISNANVINIQNGAVINARTLNEHNGGNVKINNSQILQATGGGQVITTTQSRGNAGNITIDAERVILSGSDAKFAERVAIFGQNQMDAESANSGLFANTKDAGNGGDLKVTGVELLIKEGAEVSAFTEGTGQAGTLEVKIADLVKIIGISTDSKSPSQLFFDSSNSGDAGKLTIKTSRLLIQEGGRISAATSGSGKAGILAVNTSEFVEIDGTKGNFASGLYFDSQGSGDARGITINTGRLNVQNGGTITVSGTGTGISGDLNITADAILLNNQGSLRATTAASEGGNIRLVVKDNILLRYNSEIVAEAFGTANGGNININAGGIILAILPENSDIVANAFQGQGGEIFAKAMLVLGFRQFVNRRTSESDFTAQSEFGIDGRETVEIEELEIDSLPDDFLEEGVVYACHLDKSELAQSRFVILGSGGIPQNPEEALSHDNVDVGLVEPVASPLENTPNKIATKSTQAEPVTEIVQAQGWLIENGKIKLVAEFPQVTFQSNSIPNPSC